ncbi:MAG: hypothetical protein QGF53_03765 [Alphaproteobacteria bacterium]|nr:hypothetical protein [Alphaproteobacteria bacterium]
MRFLALALVIVACAGAQAATLVETAVGDLQIWVLDDPDSNRVLVASRGGSRLIDLESSTVYLIASDGRAQMVRTDALPDPADNAPTYMVEKVGPGPRVADHPTTRFLLRIGAKICSTIDANLNLAVPLAGATKAFAMLDRLESAVAGGNRPPCERIPYSGYARIGWGLRVVDDGVPAVETKAIIRDYEPLEDELAVPASAVDVTDALLDATGE